MANTKTAKKQILISRRNHLRNVHYRTMLKSALKKARSAIGKSTDAGVAQLALNDAVKALYTTASKGVIKKQTAARRVGRIMRLYNKHFLVPFVAESTTA
jgi:small subunit ribosomal protein S20